MKLRFFGVTDFRCFENWANVVEVGPSIYYWWGVAYFGFKEERKSGHGLEAQRSISAERRLL